MNAPLLPRPRLGPNTPDPDWQGPPAPTAPAPTAASIAATQNLARPMDSLRAEANGGTLPPKEARFGEDRPLLGGTQFRLLQPRAGQPSAGGTPRPAAPAGPGVPAAGAGGMAQSSAGFTPFFDEQIAGSPRRLGGRGRRAGARFTEGPMRGKTADQAKIQLRSKYAGMSPEDKAAYERKARNEDISSPVAAPPAVGGPAVPAALPDPEAEAAATPMSMAVAKAKGPQVIDPIFPQGPRLLPNRQRNQEMMA